MKAQLGEAPATIGRVRELGAVAVLVTCSAPCRRRARVSLDALRLPDDPAFGAIDVSRRFVCEACGRRATQVAVDWDAKAEAGRR